MMGAKLFPDRQLRPARATLGANKEGGRRGGESK